MSAPAPPGRVRDPVPENDEPQTKEQGDGEALGPDAKAAAAHAPGDGDKPAPDQDLPRQHQKEMPERVAGQASDDGSDDHSQDAREARSQDPPSSAATVTATDTPLPRRHPDRLMVVGIGASAGGFEAIVELIEGLPDDPGFALVVIQHLDPSKEGRLTELLGRRTGLRVSRIEDGHRLEADHVYVIPHDAAVQVEDGAFVLLPRDERAGHHFVIDRFFRSLAEDLEDRAVGVVLSGTLADGVEGLKEIKASGGFTFAQDPDTAAFPEMPRNAIEAGYVDRVARPSDLAAELLGMRDKMRSLDQAEDDGGPPGGDEDRLQKVFRVLRATSQVDFRDYKRSTLGRRIHRRMMAHKVDDLDGYIKVLKDDPDEPGALFRELLIHVTRFFRDKASFEALKEDVIRRLLEAREEDEPLRIWVPGCASGEETYSIAILAKEAMDELGLVKRLQVFGTDISEEAIKTARDGRYPASISDHVPKKRLKRWFERTDGGYTIAKQIRNACVFAVQDVTSDAPFSNLDIVSCRNLLIYMQPDLQRHVLSIVHYALKEDGYLFLGENENIGRHTDLFEDADREHRIFRRTTKSPGLPQGLAPRRDLRRKETGDEPPTRRDVGLNAIHIAADEAALQVHGPPGIVVDNELQILEYRGDVRPFLAHPAGPASLNVMKIVKQDLAIRVRRLVHEALDTQARTKGVHMNTRADPADGAHAEQDGDEADGGPKTHQKARPGRIEIEVLPIMVRDDKPRHALVHFIEHKAPVPTETSTDGEPTAGQDRTHLVERNDELEDELASTREYLQRMIDDYEATNEELRSANEEALSANEELQSTNEELETAQEELQSTNEELSTLNDELEARNEEIQKVNNDLINLLESVDIPIIMLDTDLRIRRFTRSAEHRLNLIPTDIGRPFTDLNHGLEVPGLEAEIEQVIETLQVHEATATVHEDGLEKERRLVIRPYKTSDNRIDGAVLVLFHRS